MAMLLFLQWDDERKAKYYRWALACFALSLLAKSSGIMLPLVILAYALWRRGKITWDDCKMAAPFLAIAVVDAVIVFFPREIHYLAQPEWNLAVDEALENQTALDLDSLRSTHSIHSTVETPTEIDAAFDAISYQKGAAVLRMIERYVGEAQ